MATQQINREMVIAEKRKHLARRQEKTPRPALVSLADMQKPPKPVLNIVTRGRHITLIGQITHTEIYDPVATALRFERNGLDAIAMFTDHKIYTKGLDDMLLVARAARRTPVICQNYVLDEYHVAEVRAAGASAAMLHASVLEPPALRRVVSLAQRWKMTTILQINHEDAMINAVELTPHVVAAGDDPVFDRERDLPLLRRCKKRLPYNTKIMPLGCVQTLVDAAEIIELGVDALIVASDLIEKKADYDQLRLMLEFHSEW